MSNQSSKRDIYGGQFRPRKTDVMPSMNLQIRIDARLMAELLLYANQKDALPVNRNWSDFGRQLIEHIHSMLDDAGQLMRVETAELAVQVIQDMGFSMAQLKNYQSPGLLKALREDALNQDFGSAAYAQNLTRINTSAEEKQRIADEVAKAFATLDKPSVQDYADAKTFSGDVVTPDMMPTTVVKGTEDE